jgi:hypothetical protein
VVFGRRNQVSPWRAPDGPDGAGQPGRPATIGPQAARSAPSRHLLSRSAAARPAPAPPVGRAAAREPAEAEEQRRLHGERTERRVVIKHNANGFPDVLRAWAEAGRGHHGRALSFLRTNAYGEMGGPFDRWFGRFPSPGDWIDRVAAL